MRQRLSFALPLIAFASLLGCGDGSADAPEVNNDTRDFKEEGCKPGETSCIDSKGAALCPANTGYPGDGYALCAPPSNTQGVLLHYGPDTANGRKPPQDELDKFLLPAGAEAENCVYVRSTNTEPMWVNAYNGRLRPNSHHLIVTMVSEDKAAGVPLNTPVDCSQAELFGDQWLLGSQDPQIDIYVEGTTGNVKPAAPTDPEYGAAQLIQPNQLMRIDAHYINASPDPLLREAWVYLRAVPKEQVKQQVDMITFFQTSIYVPPGSTGVTTERAGCAAPTDRYINLVTGHFHRNGTRFSVWHEKLDGTSTLIYETHDWDTPGNAFYNARVVNPPIDGKTDVWGATSGHIQVLKGEKLTFQCQFDNPTNGAVRFGELGKDQMCNIFGLYYPTDGGAWNCTCIGPACL